MNRTGETIYFDALRKEWRHFFFGSYPRFALGDARTVDIGLGCSFSFLCDGGHILKEHAVIILVVAVGVSILGGEEIQGMCRSLPPDSNLDDIKKEARKLLHALHRREAAALRRYYSIDSLAGLARPRLDDAQYVIAREHGYGSWQKLTEHLPTASSETNC